MPLDYNVPVANPFRGLPQAIGEGVQRKALAEKEQALQAEAQSLFESGNLNDIAAFSIANPEMGKRVAGAAKHKSDATKDVRRNAMRSIMSGDDPIETVQRAATGIKRLGGDPSDMLKLLQMSPEEIKQRTGPAMAMQFPEEMKSLLEYQKSLGGDGGALGTVSPKDFTVESMADYEKSGEIADLVRYRPKTVKIGNIEHSYNAETQKYEPVVDYGSTGLTTQEVAAAENEAARQSRLEFGKQKSKWEGLQSKALGSIGGAEQKQTVIRNTADRIKDLVGGWSTKYGASLSSIPGSEARTLKGLIDTIKANSAFTTLTELKAAGGTLGAISEAELNLLERAWGALDQGGDSQEFLRVLDQLVGQNTGSLQRTREAYNMNKKRFSGGYDESQRQQQDENTVSWGDM